MKGSRFARALLRTVTGVFAFLGVLCALWFIGGSLEMTPTAEQQGKVKLASALLTLVFAAATAWGRSKCK